MPAYVVSSHSIIEPTYDSSIHFGAGHTAVGGVVIGIAWFSIHVPAGIGPGSSSFITSLQSST